MEKLHIPSYFATLSLLLNKWLTAVFFDLVFPSRPSFSQLSTGSPWYPSLLFSAPDNPSWCNTGIISLYRLAGSMCIFRWRSVIRTRGTDFFTLSYFSSRLSSRTSQPELFSRQVHVVETFLYMLVPLKLGFSFDLSQIRKAPALAISKAVLIVTTCYISYAFPVTGTAGNFYRFSVSIFYAPVRRFRNCNLGRCSPCRYLYRTHHRLAFTDHSRADYCLRHRFSCLIITLGL